MAKNVPNDKGQLISDDPSADVNEAWSMMNPKAMLVSRNSAEPEAQSAFSCFYFFRRRSSVYDLRIGDSRVRGSWDGSRTHVW